jgi:hypothetical protein
MDKTRVLFDSAVMTAVGVGWVITVLGALVLLACAVWWSAANRSRTIDQAPSGWRPAVGLGMILFVGGLAWQVLGYARIGIARF